MMNNIDVVGTMGISHAIEKMIDESGKFLIFVTPYLKITERLRAKLVDAFDNVDSCYFIYRKDELRKDEKRWLESFNNVHLLGVENLHAKLYLNEKECIIGSMNFYEYSQINNYEIGVVINAAKDIKNFQKIAEEILLITKLTEKHDSIFKLLEPFLDYTVRTLFNKLQKVSKRYKTQYYSDDTYIQFCNDARKLVQFNDNELYNDKRAILRSANIGKERYEKLFKKLK